MINMEKGETITFIMSAYKETNAYTVHAKTEKYKPLNDGILFATIYICVCVYIAV